MYSKKISGAEYQSLCDKSIFSLQAKVHRKISNTDCLRSGPGDMDGSHGSGPLRVDTKYSAEGVAKGKSTGPTSISSLDMTLPMGRNS